MKKQSATLLFELPIETSDGQFLATYSRDGLMKLQFPEPPPSPRGRSAGQRAPVTGLPKQVRSWHALTTKALKAVLQGKPQGTLPPLDFAAGTPFQQSVWRALAAMPLGTATSYGRLAATVGRPAAVRAVGRACGANPVPVLVPCHRVLTSTSALGGFSGGLDWKRKLLRAEGVSVR